MGVKSLEIDCYTAAIDRLTQVMRDPNKAPIFSFSGGKDSTAVLHLALQVWEDLHLSEPLDVIWYDDEVVYPSTRQMIEGMFQDDRLAVNVISSTVLSYNVYNRAYPFFHPYDPKHIDDWVYPPDEQMVWFEGTISEMVRHGQVGLNDDGSHFELWEDLKGKELISVQGIRAEESMTRRAASHKSENGLFSGKKSKHGISRVMYPIYDWKDTDVWTYFNKFELVYNSFYDHMFQAGIGRRDLRLGQTGQTFSAHEALDTARKVWPNWFQRVCNRLPGIAEAFQPGWMDPRDIKPGEGQTWADMLNVLISDSSTPKWIARKARECLAKAKIKHAQHSTGDLPDSKPCPLCRHDYGSYRALFRACYSGDITNMASSKLGVKPIQWEEINEYSPKPTASVPVPESEDGSYDVDAAIKVCEKLAKPEFDQAWVRA